MIKINRLELQKALSIVSKAVNPKPIIPLLSNILLEVEGNDARFSATNYEIGIKTNIPIEGNESFAVAIPAKLFADLINNIQTDDGVIELEFNASNQQISVHTSLTKNKVNCMNADDFPSIPVVSKPVKLSSTEFKDMIGRVTFAANPNNASKLNGVLIEVNGNELIMFAVDGFRLSFEKIQIKNPKNYKMKAIVPSAILNLLSRTIESDKELEFSVNDNQVRFRVENTDIFSQKVDGDFPDYNQLKVDNKDTIVEIGTLQLLRSCKQLELFTDEDKNVMVFNVDGMLLKLSAVSQQKGNSDIVMTGTIKGSSIKIGINIGYLKQFLESCNTEQVVIKFKDNKSPILLNMKNVDNYFHIIMPNVNI